MSKSNCRPKAFALDREWGRLGIYRLPAGPVPVWGEQLSNPGSWTVYYQQGAVDVGPSETERLSGVKHLSLLATIISPVLLL